MAHIRTYSAGGTLTGTASDSNTTLSSDEFASLPEVVVDVDTLTLILDPAGVDGAPEVVDVVAHSSASSSVDVVRGRETSYGASVAREHASGTAWASGPTFRDFDPWGVTLGSGHGVTRSDGRRAMLVATDVSLSYAVEDDGPVMIGFVVAAHCPPDPVNRFAKWRREVDPRFGDLLVVVDDAAGSDLGFPGGLWVQDSSGLLTDVDEVVPMLDGVGWWVA